MVNFIYLAMGGLKINTERERERESLDDLKIHAL